MESEREKRKRPAGQAARELERARQPAMTLFLTHAAASSLSDSWHSFRGRRNSQAGRQAGRQAGQIYFISVLHHDRIQFADREQLLPL